MTTDFAAIRTLFDIRENHGFDDDTLAILAKKFGTLPKVLSDYYATLGNLKALNHTQNTLLAPHQIRWSNCQNYLVFYTENQRACVWGIRRQDLTQDNPAAYGSIDEKAWVMESPCVSDFLDAMAQVQAVFGFEHTSQAFIWFDSDDDLQTPQTHYPKKPFVLLHWYDGIEFYGDKTEVIAVFNYENFAYACQDYPHF